MRVSAEALLMAAALSLYLFDSILLLPIDEAVLWRGRGGRWSAGFGLDRWRLSGKEPCLPNPLAPHRPLFRLRWRMANAAPQGSADPVRVPAELAGLGPHTLVSGVCLFVLLPVVLFAPQGTAFSVAVLALLYGNIVVALVRLYRRRTAFALAPRQFGVLAFECVVCPPFSINLVRKLCAQLGPDEDLVHAALRLLPADALAAFKAQCLRRVDEQIDHADDGSPLQQALRTRRESFVTHDPDDA